MGKWKRRRGPHELSDHVDVNATWDMLGWSQEVGLTEHDFTEMQARFQHIHTTMRKRQFADSGLKKLTKEELIYIAGHAEPGVLDAGSPPVPGTMPEDERQKVVGNSFRARAELERRSRRSGLLLTLLVSALVSVAVVFIAEQVDDDPAPTGPPATTQLTTTTGP